MTELHAYMGCSDSLGPEEGACLIFARNAREAKKVGYSTIQSWLGSDWLDMRVRRLDDEHDYLVAQASPDKYAQGIPHTIEDPAVCPNCDLWGGGPVVDGHCELCEGEY